MSGGRLDAKQEMNGIKPKDIKLSHPMPMSSENDSPRGPPRRQLGIAAIDLFQEDWEDFDSNEDGSDLFIEIPCDPSENLNVMMRQDSLNNLMNVRKAKDFRDFNHSISDRKIFKEKKNVQPYNQKASQLVSLNEDNISFTIVE